jgi:DNA-binding NarL/FixJ family response regulator
VGNLVEIVLADNHETVAEGLRLFLENEEDLAVVSITRNGDTGLRVMHGERLQVLVLDLSSLSDLTAVMEDTAEAVPGTRIVALSTADHAETMWAARRLQGDLRVVENASREQLVHALREVPEGGKVLVSFRPTTRHYQRDPEIELLVRTLSRRERDILELITAGYSNQEIAKARFLSMHTVRTHIQSILVKLDVHSKLEAAIFAVRHRIVLLDGERPGRDQQPTSASNGR